MSLDAAEALIVHMTLAMGDNIESLSERGKPLASLLVTAPGILTIA